MINCIIPSKDRAAQLDLLLRSIEDNFKELQKVYILFKYTSEDFKKGYDKLIESYKYSNRFVFIKEENFVANFKQIVSLFNEPYSLTLADDEVVIRDFEIEKSLSSLDNSINYGISLRLHPDINYTYTTSMSSPINLKRYSIERPNNVYSWRWSDYNPLNEFGYIGNINSEIYTTDFLKWCVNSLPFRNYNHLEELMFSQRAFYKPFNLCYEKAKTLSVAANVTQRHLPNNKRSSNIENSLESLNKKYLEGFIIDSNKFYNLNYNMATCELDFDWRKI